MLGIFNPSKPAEEVEKEAQEGHEAYVHSHNACYVGNKNVKNIFILYIRPLPLLLKNVT